MKHSMNCNGLARILRVAAFPSGALVLLIASAQAPRETGLSGSITGFVGVTGSASVGGSPAAPKPIDMSGDAYCQRVNSAQVLEQSVVADAQGRLADVVIYVKEGAAGTGGSASQDSVVLDQQNCMYTPRTIALRANQTLVIRNSDQTLHNVHVRPSRNREFNLGQPLRGTRSRRTFPLPEVGIAVACDIHGWMHASIAVFDHPYFAVTNNDGSFAIADLPAGDYVIEAWHAALGTQQQRVTVTAGAPAQVSFTFPAR
jgi:hypothetical protein